MRALFALSCLGALAACDAATESRFERAAAANAATPVSADDAIVIDENVIAYTTENADLKAARAKAAETLPAFVERLKNDEPGTYMIKFPLTQNGETEHIWLEVSSVQHGQYIGSLANAPVNGTDYKLGDAMIIDESDVEDWMIQSADGIRGGYAARYQVKQLPAAKRREIESQFID